MQTYDVIVIGAGPAGEKAALEARSHGAKVAVIEKANSPGGASVITGTIPSKSIWETVRYIDSFSNKALSGLDVQLKKQVTVQDIMHRKKIVTEERSQETLRSFQQTDIEYIEGKATFLDAHHIIVTKHSKSNLKLKLKAKKIIIAVGTRPYRPSDVPFDNQMILDSDTILKISEIPKSITIFGGGVIGCEYATIFAKMGVRVYLIDTRGILLNFLDHGISSCLKYLMEKSGITLRLGEQYKSIQVENKQVKTVLRSGKVIYSSVLLYANGRQGNADTLNVKTCGLEMNSRNQLDVNDNFQTKIPHIYAVGDVIGFPSLVSTSNEEGRLAGKHATTNKEVKRIKESIPLGIYTIPEISMVGSTEEELTKACIPYEIGVCHFQELVRAKMLGGNEGLLKLLFQRESKKLLGVHIIGPSATELIHVGQAVIHYGDSIEYFIESVMNFPTLSSSYKVAAYDGLSRLL